MLQSHYYHSLQKKKTILTKLVHVTLTLVMQNVWKVTKRLKSDFHYEWVLKSLYSSNFSWTIRPNFRHFEVIFHPRIKSIISPMKWSTSTNITVIDYISKGFGYVLKLHHKFRLDFRQRYFTAANSFKYWDWNSDVKGLYLGWSILKWMTNYHLTFDWLCVFSSDSISDGAIFNRKFTHTFIPNFRR